METLKLILKGYINGDYSLNQMIDIVNETMEYRGYLLNNGKRELKAIFNNKLIIESI